MPKVINQTYTVQVRKSPNGQGWPQPDDPIWEMEVSVWFNLEELGLKAARRAAILRSGHATMVNRSIRANVTSERRLPTV